MTTGASIFYQLDSNDQIITDKEGISESKDIVQLGTFPHITNTVHSGHTLMILSGRILPGAGKKLDINNMIKLIKALCNNQSKHLDIDFTENEYGMLNIAFRIEFAQRHLNKYFKKLYESD
jgi:hypothetical protein